jgi:uncharacterized membrane protein
MWDLITGGLTAIASGGITGLLGIGIQRIFDWLGEREKRETLRIKMQHDLDMVKANAEVMMQEGAQRAKVAQIEGETRQEVAASEAFSASFQTEPKRYAEGPRPKGGWGAAGWFLMVLIDFIRGIVRPGLTVYLCAITTMIYREAADLIDRYGMTMPVDDAVKLVTQIIMTILYLTTTCVLWWFGTRNQDKAPAR